MTFNMNILKPTLNYGLLFLTILPVMTALKCFSKKKLVPIDKRIECPGFNRRLNQTVRIEERVLQRYLPCGDSIPEISTRDKTDCKKHGCEYVYTRKGPRCFMKKGAFGYKVENVSTTADGMVVKLVNRSADTPYGPSFSAVTFIVSYVTEEILRIKFLDNNYPRYEVPVQEDFPLLQSKHETDSSKLAYKVNISKESNVFSFQVQRVEDDTLLWDTSIGGLVLSDKYLQISSYLPSRNIYGLGEHTHPTLRHDLDYKAWPMFSQDRFPEGGSVNLYGVHPFYTCLENNSNSHGVLFLNSNAMEAVLLPAPGITFRTTGGIIDMFFFVGTDPESVVKLYTSLIGRPMLPPYWALGFQLCRWGYNSIENLKEVVERTGKAGIYQDVQFLDIDHMDNKRDFTINRENFSGLVEYIRKTREEYGLKWIIILDPAIEAIKGYKIFDSGLKDDVFIKRSPLWKEEMFPDRLRKYNITFGKVWPETEVAFPNFFDKKTRKWWIDAVVEHHRKELPFDGLWIDMNEPSNFGTNEDIPSYCQNKTDCWSLKCPQSSCEDPPYNPLKNTGSARLSAKTLCMESVQSAGNKNYRHYDVHSLYGWSQSQPTFQAAVKAVNQRSLVISRSTYPSSGRYVGHWLGDNKSIWDDLYRSIVGMLEFNIFGIPYVGADVCGFEGNTTNELCTRWMQLGAFYPFFRNHNGLKHKDQDPAALGADVIAASKRAVDRRYALNPYLYTLFYRAHVNGSTVVRPLFHEFPKDEKTWNIGEQFMWGRCLLISPVLKEGMKSLKLYLPHEEWWHFKFNESRQEKKTGDYMETNDIFDNIPLHVRGGCIIPTEDYKQKKPNPETDYLKNYTLYVFPALDEAWGEIYVDQLVSLDPIKQGKYEVFEFRYKSCTLKIRKSSSTSVSFQAYLTKVFVFKVKAVKRVQADLQEMEYFLNNESNVLTIIANKAFDKVPEITWRNEDGKCEMSP